jgi:hemerythrin
MPFMAWNDRLVLGIEEIDSDHKKLVEMINELYDGIQAGRGREALVGILDRLMDYTRYHFAREERLWEESGSPRAAEHKKAHDAMVEVVVRAQAEYVDGGAVAPSLEMMVFLKDWLFDHILGSDRRDAVYLVKVL